MTAYEEGRHVYTEFADGEITSAGTDSPYCPEDPRHQQFADGFQAAHEGHQVTIN